MINLCRNPTLKKCEDETHIPEMGTWESSETLKTLEFNYRDQNTSSWGVLYMIGKLLKFRCQKWAHMGHSNIYSTCYGKKKGQESNWQFDSRPLKVRNRPDFDVCRLIMTHYWKDLEESYMISLDLVPIGG